MVLVRIVGVPSLERTIRKDVAIPPAVHIDHNLETA
jgi:hypothetical protein